MTKMQIDCPFCRAPLSIEIPDQQEFLECRHCSEKFLVLPIPEQILQIEYFCYANEEELGPFGAEEVMELYEQGILDAHTTIWYDGLQEWLPIFDVFPSFPYLKQRPADVMAESELEPEDNPTEQEPVYAETATGAGTALNTGTVQQLKALDDREMSPDEDPRTWS